MTDEEKKSRGIEIPPPAIKPLDKDGLYEVHTFTDAKVGDMRMLVPMVVNDASCLGHPLRDGDRPLRYFSSVTLSIGGAKVPTSFEIYGATSLADAIDKCPAAALAEGEKLRKRLEEQRHARPLVLPQGMTKQ